MLALVQGELGGTARAEAERHIDGCAECRRVVASAAELQLGSGPGPEPQSGLLPANTQVGRYVVAGCLGEGGMGVVYRAFDPVLKRDVALKLIRPGGVPEGLLLQEAQSMAKLSHPNVVAIYDTGTYGQQAFLAMEYVDGKTLKKWLREAKRDWQQVLAVFADVAKGLSAAHGAELVHRDIKPENILVGRDGRAKVTDFGVARFARTDSRTPPLRAGDPIPIASSAITVFTDHGACVGTPAYMAPEQFMQREVGPWTDQFSFCVALYEAIYGARPFGGSTLGERVGEVIRGNVRTPPPSKVPPGVLAVLRRGLHREPAERYPSLADLVSELEVAARAAPERPRRRRRSLVIAACASAAPAALVLWIAHRRPGAPTPPDSMAATVAPTVVTTAQPPEPPVAPVARVPPEQGGPAAERGPIPVAHALAPLGPTLHKRPKPKRRHSPAATQAPSPPDLSRDELLAPDFSHR